MMLYCYFRLLRPRQWLKNLMIYFPPFLSGALQHPGMLSRGILPLIAFCCASSASYILNDLCDVENDTHHPKKRTRPIASGEVSRNHAIVFLIVLLILAGFLSWSISPLFLGYVLLYLSITFTYSFKLKQLPIFDVFSISFGFVLRLYSGGEVFDVYVSDWLFLSVFLLSLFLSIGKRCGEQKILGDAAPSHRSALAHYPDGFLESAMYLTGAAVLITYAMYAISTPLLVYSVPLCVFGLLRYLLNVKSGGRGEPVDALLKDPVLFMVGFLWVVMVGLSVYQ
ncbi:MAG: decaprenyl-phosphate phosphoribosyltransferase [Desulfuromonas sp.]|nr:MAG: decaprenyl-phosphate phosphoribosyltransferase [Desulfuromonas sp.]